MHLEQGLVPEHLVFFPLQESHALVVFLLSLVGVELVFLFFPAAGLLVAFCGDPPSPIGRVVDDCDDMVGPGLLVLQVA
jgi:hypothetical protein